MNPQREGYQFLMSLAKGSLDEMCAIQWWRICMHVTTLADVFSADGTALKESSMTGLPFTINLDWPNQARPLERDWKKWRSFLKTFLNHDGSAVKAQ